MENTKKLNDALRDLERALDDNKDYRAMLDKIQASYNAEIQFMREDAQKKIAFLVSQVEQLRRDNDNLWAENIRKSRIIDMLIEKNNVFGDQK